MACADTFHILLFTEFIISCLIPANLHSKKYTLLTKFSRNAILLEIKLIDSFIEIHTNKIIKIGHQFSVNYWKKVVKSSQRIKTIT